MPSNSRVVIIVSTSIFYFNTVWHLLRLFEEGGEMYLLLVKYYKEFSYLYLIKSLYVHMYIYSQGGEFRAETKTYN